MTNNDGDNNDGCARFSCLPNHDSRRCPLVRRRQVDLLRRRTSEAASRARPEAPIAPGVVEGGRSEVAGQEEEDKVLSLRLVGMGVQLHSKSFGARFSFSLQDLDLEVTLFSVRSPRRS